jgi:hypothetical protein
MSNRSNWVARNVDFARKLWSSHHRVVSVTATIGKGRWKSTVNLIPREAQVAYTYNNNSNNNINNTAAHANTNTHTNNTTNLRGTELNSPNSYVEFVDVNELSVDDSRWSDLMSASETRFPAVCAESREMNLMEAADQLHNYDKILLLVSHAETRSEMDTRLSGRGAGQALSLSRMTASFCNKDTGLVPELIVLSNHQPVIQTAMKAFPYYTPLEIEAVPWISHPLLLDDEDEAENDVLMLCDGDDDNASTCSFSSSHSFAVSTDNNKKTKQLLDRSDDFLKWIQTRKEKVIVVSSQSSWLQAFGCSLGYSGASNSFGYGEMRAVGVNFKRSSY